MLRRRDATRRVAQADAVPGDRALGGVVEARDQFRERRLAAARLADERDHAPRGDAHRHVAQHAARVRRVAEGDVLEFDGVAQRGEFDGVGLLRRLLVLVHHLPDVAHGGERLLHPVVQARELAHRVVGGEEEEEEGDELRGGHVPAHDLALREEEEDGDREHADQLDGGRGGAVDLRGAQVRAHHLPRDAREALALSLLGDVRLDDVVVRERLLRRVHELLPALVGFAREVAEARRRSAR